MEASTAHVAERILADDKHAGTAQGSLTCDAEAATLLQNLSLESETKQPGGSDTANQVDNRDGTSRASDVGASGAAPARAGTPFPHDFVVEQQHQPVYFGGYPPPPFYYGGYEGSAGDWDEYRFVNGEGIEIPGAGVYGDNNTLVYPPSYGYASHVPYAPYTPAGTPVPTMGAADGQIYGPQAFQYNGQFYQQPVPSAAPYVPCTTPPLPKPEVSTSSTDQVNVTVDASNGNSDGGTKPIYPLAAVPLNRSYGRGSTALPLESSNSNGPGAGGDAPWMDGVAATSSDAQVGPSIKNGGAVPQSTPLKPLTQGLRPPIMGMPPPRGHLPIGPGSGYVNRVYSSGRMLPQSSYRTGRGPFGNNGYEARPNGRAWNFFDKNKARGRGSGTLYSYNEGMDLLNEQNRGPRTARFRNQRLNSTSSWQVKGQNTMTNNNTEPINVVPNRDQYNRPEFLIKYNNAKFFIIKSYSEDDIHKSIKYNVWASTPNGNKKLDSAYIEAHEMSGDCPVFLFFSVNASGQFCGVAEMTGPVDFNKSVDYWQQDKWSGHFPVKWHIVKDVPNNQLRHIILENNDNKPVTNSRDTQEVIFDKGIEMLKIFKDYVSKTSILDDFIFYEGRQKAMQERRARQLSLFQHKQVTQSYNAKESSHDHQENVTLELQDGKGSDSSLDAKDAESRSRKLCELGDCGVSTNEKHSVQPHGNHGTLSNERSTSGISASAWKGVKPTTILKRESNGNATNKSSQSNGS